MKAPGTAHKRAALHTLGCRLNQSETLVIQEKLQAAGYAIVPFGEPADLAIVNTCTVTHDADAKSRKAIRGFIRRNPEAYVAVIGCYAQTGYNDLCAIEGVDLIIGNQEKMNVLDYIGAGKNDAPLVVRDRFLRDDFTFETAGGGAFEKRANLKVQDGCDFMCSFCIIPFARGRARSRRLGNLIEEAEQLIERGAKELVLTGVNIGLYSYEGFSLIDVIDRLNDFDDLARIRISSIEPTTIDERLFERMTDPDHRLVPYLHIPLQSGSDAVLSRMRRLYTRREVLEFVERVQVAVPGIGIGTDVMVGFPGETDAEFADTCSALRDGPFDYAHVFKYSMRDGTAAARDANQIPPEVKNRRSAEVRRISAEKTRKLHERLYGEMHDVLFEQAENGVWTGYTGNYARVAVRSDAILANALHPVTLGESRGDVILGALNQTAEVCA